MPKHERSEYMKGVLFAEEQKEIGWVFDCVEDGVIIWTWHVQLEGFQKGLPKQKLFRPNKDFIQGVIDYQKHMERLK